MAGALTHPLPARQDGTLVVVHAINEDDSPGNDVLVCTRSSDGGASWSPSAPIDCTRFAERPKHAIPELDGKHEVRRPYVAAVGSFSRTPDPVHLVRDSPHKTSRGREHAHTGRRGRKVYPGTLTNLSGDSRRGRRGHSCTTALHIVFPW